MYNGGMKINGWNQRKIQKENRFLKTMIVFALVLSIVFLSYHFFRTLNITNEKLKILEIAQEDVAQLRMENLKLVLEKSEIVSIDYIEKEARDKLRYSKDDEILFVIPDELLESSFIQEELALARGFLNEEEDMDTQEVFQVWFDFLFVSGI
jgi:cell division protein FtsB